MKTTTKLTTKQQKKTDNNKYSEDKPSTDRAVPWNILVRIVFHLHVFFLFLWSLFVRPPHQGKEVAHDSLSSIPLAHAEPFGYLIVEDRKRSESRTGSNNVRMFRFELL
jgi:hypothetical protein